MLPSVPAKIKGSVADSVEAAGCDAGACHPTHVITYTAAIGACKTSKDQWQMAQKLLAEMQVHVIQPM